MDKFTIVVQCPHIKEFYVLMCHLTQRKLREILKFAKNNDFFLLIGPEKWPELFPMASGHRQSPVNISRESTTRGRSFKVPLSWRYVPQNTKSLINPGYCWRVDVNGEGSSLSGGPLSSDVFQLEQFHCHVSKTNTLN